MAKRLVPGVAAGDRWAGEDEEDDVKVPRPGSGASGGVPAAPPGAGRRRWAWGGAGGSRGHAARGPPSGWVGPRGAARPGRGGPALRVWPGTPPPCCCRALGAAGGSSPSAIAAPGLGSGRAAPWWLQAPGCRSVALSRSQAPAAAGRRCRHRGVGCFRRSLAICLLKALFGTGFWCVRGAMSAWNWCQSVWAFVSYTYRS